MHSLQVKCFKTGNEARNFSYVHKAVLLFGSLFSRELVRFDTLWIRVTPFTKEKWYKVQATQSEQEVNTNSISRQ